MANQENADLQNKIMAEWLAFSRTDAYKDWVQSMDETMAMIQDNVDNMTEPRPSILPGQRNLEPINAEKATLMNQRKVGIKYAMQYPALRIADAQN